MRHLWKKVSGKYYIAYTLIFAIMIPAVFCVHITEGKSLVWNSDGLRQHYIALVYFGQWGREVLKNIFILHTFKIPLWDFHIGFGSDIITTFHYYVFGDPLNLFSILVPPKYTEYLYGTLIIFRMYLAGISFSLFCFKMEKSRIATLAGAFSYIFCGYMLYSAARHPFFLNPMIYLPLMLIGAENIFKGKKSALFSFMVFLSAISNFYFFYMIAFAVCFYVCVRFFTFRHAHFWKELFVLIGRFFLHACLGLFMSAVILLPVLLQFSETNRMSASQLLTPFYTYSYYKNFLTRFMTSKFIGQWTILGFTLPAVLSLFVLFGKRKQHTALKISFLIMTGMLWIPFFGKAMNGFSYVSNRWCFLYAALISYIMVTVWQDMTALRLWHFKLSSGFLIIVLLIHSCLNWNALFSGTGKNRITNYIDFGTVYKKVIHTPPKALGKIIPRKTEFARHEMDDFKIANSAVLTKENGVHYYWSLENGAISDYLMGMAPNRFRPFNYRDLDHRTFLDAIAGVKYFIQRNSDFLPFGYEYKKTVSLGTKEYDIYENSYALPLGFTYQSYIPYESYNKMEPIMRQEAMLQGVILENDTDSSTNNLPITKPEFTSRSLDYAIECENNVLHMPKGNFTVSKENAKTILSFTGMKKCETYLWLHGVDICPENSNVSEMILKISSDSSNNILRYDTSYHKLYDGQKDFLINLGYHEEPLSTIQIQFPKQGTYYFEDIKVICQPMKNYITQLEALRECRLENEKIETNTVKGTVNLPQDRILFLSIPYSKGWHALADGEETTLLKANIMYLSLPLEKGTHNIELYYRTPGLSAGIGISFISFLLFLFIFILRKKKES